MKTASLILLLTVIIYVGWQSHVRREEQEQKRMHELFEGYDRCVAPLDESIGNSRLSPGWNSESPEGKKILREWMEARTGCRDFYFGGTHAK